MTTRTIVFDSPFLLGFEHTRALIERTAKAAGESYPPYNVEQLEGDRIRITLAVAGFTPEQLQVTVEGVQLVVSGRREADGERTDGGGYLHRGIAARGFTRSFVLADGMVVDAAILEHGLLHVEVSRPEAETRIKRIPIRTAS